MVPYFRILFSLKESVILWATKLDRLMLTALFFVIGVMLFGGFLLFLFARFVENRRNRNNKG